MALKATIFKAVLSISDMDRQYYATHLLVLARLGGVTPRALAQALRDLQEARLVEQLLVDEFPPRADYPTDCRRATRREPDGHPGESRMTALCRHTLERFGLARRDAYCEPARRTQ